MLDSRAWNSTCGFVVVFISFAISFHAHFAKNSFCLVAETLLACSTLNVCRHDMKELSSLHSNSFNPLRLLNLRFSLHEIIQWSRTMMSLIHCSSLLRALFSYTSKAFWTKKDSNLLKKKSRARPTVPNLKTKLMWRLSAWRKMFPGNRSPRYVCVRYKPVLWLGCCM